MLIYILLHFLSLPMILMALWVQSSNKKLAQLKIYLYSCCKNWFIKIITIRVKLQIKQTWFECGGCMEKCNLLFYVLNIKLTKFLNQIDQLFDRFRILLFLLFFHLLLFILLFQRRLCGCGGGGSSGCGCSSASCSLGSGGCNFWRCSCCPLLLVTKDITSVVT